MEAAVRSTKARLAAVLTSAVLAIGLAAAPAASAQQNVNQQGLVNVNVGDVTVLENVALGVAANVAANICGVQVNAAVLATQGVVNDEPSTICTVQSQEAPVDITITNPDPGPGGGGGPQNVMQEGLVNVNVGDVTVLENVAVGVAANVAANVCGVQVNVALLAAQEVVNTGDPATICMTGEQDAPVTITI
jgi:hypothetical protein